MPSGSATLLIAFARLLQIERQPAAEQPLRIEIAEHEIGVGDGRLGAALSVAGRTRVCAGALRADLQQPHAVDPADRAAARAERLDLNHRNADPVSQHVDVLADIGHAVARQRDVERRAAHIDGNDVLLLERRGDEQAGLGRRGRPGIDGVNRPFGDRLAEAQSAVRLKIPDRIFRAEPRGNIRPRPPRSA